MRDYVITTDSNSDVRPEFVKENNLTIIPQYYAFGDTVYGDELNMEPHEFYETMRKGELPKSMANNPAVIRERFEKILKQGKDILHIAFSSALSGSYNNVVMMAGELMEDYPDRTIRVFDSLNASLGEGVSVYRAVELWKQGKTMDEVWKILEEEREHVNVSFTVNDLNHLQRGGRVSKTTAVVGSLVNIKPVLTVTSTGELKADGTVRGRKKSLKTLVNRMEIAMDLEHYGKEILSSANINQILSYVLHEAVEFNGKVSGMLLYAKTKDAPSLREKWNDLDHDFYCITLDLDNEFEQIAKQLDDIAKLIL